MQDYEKLEIIHSKLSLLGEKIQQVINGKNKKLSAIAEDLFLKFTIFTNAFFDNLGNLNDKDFDILANKILKKLNSLDADNPDNTIKIISALSPSYNGDAIEALAQVKTIGEVDPLSGITKIKGVNIFSPKGAANIGVGAAKIFRYALAAFTKITHQNTPSDKLKDGVRLFLDLNDYAQANGVDITSDTARRNFRRKIRNDLEKLRQAGATWTEKIKGKETRYAGINYIGKYEVKGDTIMIEFTVSMAEYLVSLPIVNYPRALYSLKDNDYNTFAIGEALAIHYGIDNNVLRGTECKLKIDTLLKYTSFPSLEELRANRWYWVNYVKTPFEQCLDRLYQSGFLKDYCYCFAGGQELTDDEARTIIDKDYGYFVSLLIKYELNDYEDSLTRAKAIAKKRAEKMKKLTEAKKRKKSGNH